MTPDKRLNQIEPVLADVVQKVDRLIEGQGQIIAEVSKIPGIERTVSITAKGLADLTTSVKNRFDQLQQGVNNLAGNADSRFDQLQQEVNNLAGNADSRFDQLQQEVNNLAGNADSRFDQLQQEVNNLAGNADSRFDQLQQEVTGLRLDQALILQILREKLP